MRYFMRVLLGGLLLVSGFSFLSCNKFLDAYPDDKVLQSELLSDEQGFKDALIGVYLGMDKAKYAGNYGLYTMNMTMGMVSTMGYDYDNANINNAGGGNNFYNNLVYYNYEDGTVKLELAGLWNGMYNNIANLNNILTQIDGNRGIFTGDNYDRIKGEALGLRAMFHFDLLRLFAPSALVGATSKGIPYVTRFTVESTHFSTVGATLDSCIHDLVQARELLAKTDTSTVLKGAQDPFKAYTQNHLNFWAVEGMLARVYLYKGDYKNARLSAEAVTGSGKFPLITSNVAAPTNIVRDRLFSQELLFALYSAGLAKENSSIFDLSSGTPLRLTPVGKARIYTSGSGSASDYRYSSWFDINQNRTEVPSKYFQDDNLPYALKDMVPLLRVSEMYYIIAECANDADNVATGVAVLNQVRQARGLDALDPAGINKDSLSTEIMHAYQKEFIQEGQTFYYYKRLNKDLKAVTPNPATIPADAYVIPIPDKENEYNH